MICTECRVAGRLNQAANKTTGELRETGYAMAAKAHLDCDGRCDCQHITGMALNTSGKSE